MEIRPTTRLEICHDRGRDPRARPGASGRKPKFWFGLRKKAQPSPVAPYKISPGYKASALKKSEKSDFAQNRSSLPENSAELAQSGHRGAIRG